MGKNNKHSNPCIRCGKERIDLKSWQETVMNFMGTSVITYTETVCADPECQKIVEKNFEIQRKKRELFEKNKESRKTGFKRVSGNKFHISITSRK